MVFSDQLEKQWCVIKLDLVQFLYPRRDNFAIERLNVSYSLASFWIFFVFFHLKIGDCELPLFIFSSFFSRNMKNPLINVRTIWPSLLKIHYQAESFGLWTIKLFVSNLFGHLVEMQSNLRQILIFFFRRRKKVKFRERCMPKKYESHWCLRSKINVKRQKIKFFSSGFFNHSNSKGSLLEHVTQITITETRFFSIELNISFLQIRYI